MIISLIAAMTPQRVIGVDGKLPWHIPEDLKRFKRLTMGHAIIMGRKTFDSIGRALPGRRNMVITRGQSTQAPGVDYFNSLQAALGTAEAAGEQECFVIGGGSVYAEALPFANKLYLTMVKQEVSGDVYFPAWDKSQWQEISHEESVTADFFVFERS